MATETPTEHAHVVRMPGVCGGSPLIRGTRITVRDVAVLMNAGETVDQIVQSFPHLKESWVHDAISYYLDHQSEIDKEIEDNRIENVLAEQGGVMDEKGVIRFSSSANSDGK